MPRVIDFGQPYGTREFPDSATDEEIAAEYDRVRRPLTASDYLQQATRGVVTGAAREIASIPKAVGIGAAELRRLVGYVPGLDFPTREGEEFSTRPEASEFYRLGQLIEKAGEAVAPAEVPELRESFLATQVPQAVGSGVGFLAGGGATRLLRRGVTGAAARVAERRLAEAAAEKGASLGTKALAAVSEGAEIGTLGAVSQFQSEYDKAINAGADRDTALKAGLLGLPIGATEAFGVGGMIRNLDRFSGGGFTRYLIHAGAETFEEALQEAAQNFASNAVEKGLYNPAKDLLDDIAPQAAAGGAAGFLLSTLTQALGAGARRLRKGAPNAIENRAQAQETGGPAQELVSQEKEGVRLRYPTAPVPLETQAGTALISNALKPYGVTLSPRLTIFNDPSDTAPAARTQFDDNNVFQRIELNTAKLPSTRDVQRNFEHEVSHVASDSGALVEPLGLLTPQERGDIALEMSRLGYPTGSQNEFDARGTDALVSAWSQRTWFGQLVGRVTAWANETLGIKLTRRAAEAIAVRAVGRSLEKLRAPAPRQGGIQLANAFLTPPGLTRAEAALTAHHGTPHEVDRFSTSKIGTGEGAQVYGWGLYFAQNPQTAETYRKALAPQMDRRVNGELYEAGNPEHIAAYELYKAGGDRARAAESMSTYGKQYDRFANVDALRILKSSAPVGQYTEGQGNQYTVSINANDDELLDWDKPLSEQPGIKQKLAQAGWYQESPTRSDQLTGSNFYHDIARQRATPYQERAGGRNIGPVKRFPDFRSASDWLRSLGIKGIRYLDQGSRGGRFVGLKLDRALTAQQLAQIGNEARRNDWDGEFTESDLAKVLWNPTTPGADAVSRFTQKLIPGIRAEEVRSTEGGTYNYVIFDENDINITHRNGQPVKASQLQAQRTEEAKAEPVTPPPIQGVQVAGAAAQLGRVAEEAYAKREAATTQLSGLAYERQQYKAARGELRRLTELATGRLFQNGLSIEDNPDAFPNPDEGVGITDGQVTVGPEFDNKLFAAGVPFDPENTRAMQGEVYYEKEAHRLVNLRGQIDLLGRAVKYYLDLDVPPVEIKKVQDMINKLSGQAAALSEAQWNGKTIGERANEIEAAEAARPGLVAKRQALGLGPVNEFFGRQVGGFRAFLEKAQQGLRLAAALRDKATTPEELNAAVAQTVDWLVLPEEVKAAILSGRGLTDEQRGAAFAALASAFEDFDIQREMMGALRDSGVLEINRKVRELLPKISEAKIGQGMEAVFRSDIKAALKGQAGGTGTLQSQATAQALEDRISAIIEFAEKLGKNIETNGALFEWLVNPSGPAPSGNALGVSQQTLDMILAEVKKNPELGSAVVTLVNAANKKLANLPIVQIKEIETLIAQGDKEEAKVAAQKMIANAKARASVAATSQRQNLRELEALDIERQSLDEGVGMFNELAASPEFRALRDAVSNSPHGLLEKMDVGNNVSRTLRPFGAKGLPSHPGVVLSADDSPDLKAKDFIRVHEWAAAAQRHLDAYDHAAGLYAADPANNPSPTSLGFDLPVIRGLRDAAKRSVPGSAQELSTQSPGSRWAVPWLVRVMNKTFFSRQHSFVAKMVGGLFGTDLRAKLGDWINHFLAARAIAEHYRDIPSLRHAAMRSHPESLMNFQLYRTFWNELAHRGRTFGSPIRVGEALPLSGKAVTAEDLALLKREIQYEEELRRNIAEAHPTGGVVIRKGKRDLVRPGAYVGQFGLPRHLNRLARSFIADVVAVYLPPQQPGQPPPAPRSFGIGSDLSITSNDPVVVFWNKNPKMLIQHVLDSTRDDRAMRLDPLMAQAERTAAADWTVNGKPSINSLDDLVTELVRHFPPAPGLNIREHVVKGLNDELKQYYDAAARIQSERNQKEDIRSSVAISFTADNEFTKPAAQLELPTSMYDYGALTDTEHMLAQARANHGRIIAYAASLQRARADLHNRIVRVDNEELPAKVAFHGASLYEAKQVLGILDKLQADFEAAYKSTSPALTQGDWTRGTLGLLTSAVLAIPTVNLRNMSQGQWEVYLMSRAMGLVGHQMTFWHALGNMPRTIARFALHVGAGLARKTEMGLAFATGKNFDMLSKLVDVMAKMIFQPDFRASAQRVHELGFDTRDRFLDRMRRLWQASAESSNMDDITATKVFGRRVGRLAAMPFSGLRALFDTIGVQESDQVINSSLLHMTNWLDSRLKEVAANYGAERERQGLKVFDPTDRRWDLKPSEWDSGPLVTEQAAKNTLSLSRLFFEQAASSEGFQLERALWEYYQKSKAGPVNRVFTDRQFDAVQRGLLAEFNASTPANRPSAAAGSNVIRALLSLQGYSTDGLMKLFNVTLGGTRDRKTIASAWGKLPMLASLSLMTILIGYFVQSLIGEWEKRLRGRIPSLPTPLDRDFWTSWKRWGAGTAKMSLAQLFYIGDLALAIEGEMRNARGFDPTGKVFPISLMQRGLNTIRGMWTATGTVGDRLGPLGDSLRSLTPWALEVENQFKSSVNWPLQSLRVIRGEAGIQDRLPERRGQAGPSYGPTTIIRRNLMDAVSRFWERQKAGDEPGAAQALQNAKGELQKLQDYYASKYTKAGATPEAAAAKAQQELWRDYQELNPVVAGMLGKRPTKDEWDAIRGAITGDRAVAVDNGIAAWQAGAQALFGRTAPITREDVAAGRGGGGGFGAGSVAGIPSAIPRGPRIGGARRIGLRRVGGGVSAAPRLRISRTPAAAVRLPRTRRVGSIRLRRPRLRRLAGPRVARISAGRRRLGLAPRRRRSLASTRP